MRIGVFTSGGDAPGMNACIRAVVRTALPAGHQVIGIRRGFEGLLTEALFYSLILKDYQMDMRSVSNIIHRGGTILHTSRCPRFEAEEGQRAAAASLRRHKIDALVAIGGDGTFRGCMDLARYWDGPIIGCPGTIDNDLGGTDVTIGFSTAVRTAMEAVDKVRDTADATERLFLIEVMGRHSGQIALYTALATGADTVLLPEAPVTVDEAVKRLEEERRQGKTSWIVIVAEGAVAGGVHTVSRELAQRRTSFDIRVLVLGHLQRGGAPDVRDRILASRLGAGAVDALREGHSGKMIGEVNGRLTLTPFEHTGTERKPVPTELITLLTNLAR